MPTNINFVSLMDIDITLETLSGNLIKLPAASRRVRLPKVSHEIIKTDTIGDIPFEVRFKREIKFLPEPQDNTIYLVSGMISEIAERDDVLTPSEVGALFKNDRLITYRRLTRYTRNMRSAAI